MRKKNKDMNAYSYFEIMTHSKIKKYDDFYIICDLN